MAGPIGRGEKECLAALTEICSSFASVCSQPEYTQVEGDFPNGRCYKTVRGDIGIDLHLSTGKTSFQIDVKVGKQACRKGDDTYSYLRCVKNRFWVEGKLSQPQETQMILVHFLPEGEDGNGWLSEDFRRKRVFGYLYHRVGASEWNEHWKKYVQDHCEEYFPTVHTVRETHIREDLTKLFLSLGSHEYQKDHLDLYELIAQEKAYARQPFTDALTHMESMLDQPEISMMCEASGTF